MMKWFASHADEPSWLIVMAITLVLPGILIAATITAFASYRGRGDVVLTATVVSIVVALASVVWFSLLAPWQGIVDWG